MSEFKLRVGSRAQVMNGTAHKTSGGLEKKDLKYNNGRIVSRKLSAAAKKNRTLEKAGYTTRKGVFGAFKNGKRVTKKSKKSRKSRK